MNTTRTCLLSWCFVGSLGIGTNAQVFEWQPVTAACNVTCTSGETVGDVTCAENEIVLTGGGLSCTYQCEESGAPCEPEDPNACDDGAEGMCIRPHAVVTMFMELSAWDPDQDGDPTLGAYQGSVDADTYRGGIPGNPGTQVGCDLVPVGVPETPLAGAFQTLKVCCSDLADPAGTFDALAGSLPGGGCDASADCPPSWFWKVTV